MPKPCFLCQIIDTHITKMLFKKRRKALIHKEKPCNHLRLQGFFLGAEGEIRTLKLSLKTIENTGLFILVAKFVAKIKKRIF